MMDAAARQADPPEDEALDAMLSAWDVALCPIPTARLSTALIAALQHKRGPFALTVGDVLDQWAEDQQQRTAPGAYHPALPAGESACICKGARYLMDRTLTIAGSDYRQQMIPCPRCNPGGR